MCQKSKVTKLSSFRKEENRDRIDFLVTPIWDTIVCQYYKELAKLQLIIFLSVPNAGGKLSINGYRAKHRWAAS